MKLRYVAAVLGGLIFAVFLASVGFIAKAQPPRYHFLDGEKAKYVKVEDDPVGVVGREARYFVLNDDPQTVFRQAKDELTRKGWRVSGDKRFTRGPHETIEIMNANGYPNSKVTKGLKADQLASSTIVKVIDPRMPPAIKRRMIDWMKSGAPRPRLAPSYSETRRWQSASLTMW